MRLKLHISPCPNDTFMFDALVNGRIDTGSLRFEVEYHDIEELNRGAGLGRADISKISCAVLPAIAEHYALPTAVRHSDAATGRCWYAAQAIRGRYAAWPSRGCTLRPMP